MNSETFLIRNLSGCDQVFSRSYSKKIKANIYCAKIGNSNVCVSLTHPRHLKKTKGMKILFQFIIISSVRSFG